MGGLINPHGYIGYIYIYRVYVHKHGDCKQVHDYIGYTSIYINMILVGEHETARSGAHKNSSFQMS